ncbi:glycosyltransferase family 2 protein [Williamsia deligens]|uniref:Glycosyltransferase family 2 protein n=1 Tax=Williamsia deligens TaxID=321325 RepID=A0ABW3G378_9NOCA|nr:glycosyltransferase family 2 protein [Williamsia deligens]MCP2194118.1 Glycosyl transferase family 2 [Williamsia deligens]
MADHTPADGVTVVIPCRDEADALPDVLARIPDGFRALVVDNGSSDGTAEVARAHGATVVEEMVPGYGSAVDAGVRAASDDIVCTIDGDGSMDPAELVGLVDAVRGGADLAVGRRRPAQRGVWPLHSRIGTSLVARRVRRLHGIDVHDIGPMRAARRERLLELSVQDMRFGYPVELLVRAGRAGWTVVERDVVYSPRAAGESKVSGSVMGSVRATRDFLVALR